MKPIGLERTRVGAGVWQVDRVSAEAHEVLAALLSEVADDPTDRRALFARAWTGSAQVWFARPAHAPTPADLPAGCLLSEVAEGRLQILLLAVSPHERSRGAGRALMRAAIRWAFESDLDAVALEVRASNDPAQSLYESLGFVAVDLRPRYYPDGDQAVSMAVSLVNLSACWE